MYTSPFLSTPTVLRLVSVQITEAQHLAGFGCFNTSAGFCWLVSFDSMTDYLLILQNPWQPWNRTSLYNTHSKIYSFDKESPVLRCTGFAKHAIRSVNICLDFRLDCFHLSIKVSIAKHSVLWLQNDKWINTDCECKQIQEHEFPVAGNHHPLIRHTPITMYAHFYLDLQWID